MFKDLKSYLNILESLDSFSNIEKEYEEDGIRFFDFKINEKEFRIVIERSDDVSAIIFEQKVNNSFTYEGIQKNLSQKEVLTLFGTLKQHLPILVKTENKIIFTDDKQKLRIYLKILGTIGAKTITYSDKKIPYMIAFSTKSREEIINLDNKFKFKFWK